MARSKLPEDDTPEKTASSETSEHGDSPSAQSSDSHPHLPPRPNEVVHPSAPTEDSPKKREDPVLDLFDALHSLRDRKAMNKPELQLPPPANQIPWFLSAKFWLIALSSLSLVALVWIAQKFRHPSNETESVSVAHSSTEKTQPPSPKPVSETATTHHTTSAPVANPPPPKAFSSSTLTTPARPTHGLRPSKLQPSRTEGDTERDRRIKEEREREDRERDREEQERERERERERDREKDRDRETATEAGRDSNREATPNRSAEVPNIPQAPSAGTNGNEPGSPPPHSQSTGSGTGLNTPPAPQEQ